MNMTVFPKRGEGWRVNLANLHRKDCPDSDLEAIYPDLYRQTATKKACRSKLACHDRKR
jgi:hypothetical protein